MPTSSAVHRTSPASPADPDRSPPMGDPGSSAVLTALLAASRPFRVRLREPVRGVTHREGLLIAGPHGVGEFAPFTDHPPAHQARWLVAAISAAHVPWPAAPQPQVRANALIPANNPGLAAEIVRTTGCSVVKVKIPRHPDAAFTATLTATTAALAERPVPAAAQPALLRLDANGQWTVAEAVSALADVRRLLAARSGGCAVEYVEQPCATLAECIEVRHRAQIAVAVDESIRLGDSGVPDLGAGGRLPARSDEVDVIVCKPMVAGGIAATLDLARQAQAIGVAVVVSGSLDTSVGLALVTRVASLLPGRAAGIGTGALLAADLTDTPLLPVAGSVPSAIPPLSRDRLAAADPGPAAATAWTQRLTAAWWAGADRATAAVHDQIRSQQQVPAPWST